MKMIIRTNVMSLSWLTTPRLWTKSAFWSRARLWSMSWSRSGSWSWSYVVSKLRF